MVSAQMLIAFSVRLAWEIFHRGLGGGGVIYGGVDVCRDTTEKQHVVYDN